MSIKFTITIDDDNHSLSATNGLPFEKLATLLEDLFNLINPGSGTKCTLAQVKNGSYSVEFFTEDENYHTNFVVAHKRIEQHSDKDLREKEKKYAKTLGFILGEKYYLLAIDKDGNEVANIKSLVLNKEISNYYVTKVVNGIVTELGGKDLLSVPHVFISGHDYKIYITPEQDFQLKEYYKTHLLSLRLRQKMSMKDGHVISAKLLDFTVKTTGKMIDNLKEIDAANLNILKDINNSDDILRSLYGS